MSDDRIPAPTRRDEAPPPPSAPKQVSPGETRPDLPADGAGPGPVSADGKFPRAFADRFALVETLPAKGSEADLFLVEDRDTGGKFVLKVYRHGIEVDAELSRRLVQTTPGLLHCVTVFEAGEVDGRRFEVQEYVERGSLKLEEQWSTGQITTLVRQVADTLRQLHADRIVHRDLKPDNVLVRGTDPLNVAICDFGISRRLDMTTVFTTAAGTLAYLPPEAMAGSEVRLSSAWDWWALGMVVRSMATRRAPDVGLSEAVYRAMLVTKPVDLSAVVEPSLKQLCQGLLTRDPTWRWGASEVADWFRGGHPRVWDPNLELPPDEIEKDWAQREFSDTSAFAAAIATDWSSALAHFCPSEADAPTGRQWGAELRRLVPRADHDRLDRVGPLLTDPALPAPVRLLRFMRLLDPDCPPSYGGYRLDGDQASALARIAVDQGHADHWAAAGIVADLRRPDLLRELSGMRGGHRLRIAAHNWVRFTERWRRNGAETGAVQDAWLLFMAVDLGGAVEALRRTLRSDPRRMTLPWFAALVSSADPIDQLTALHRIGEADREAR